MITLFDLRIDVRSIMRRLHPEIPRHKWFTLHIHHKDRNHSNNDIPNLQIIDRREHKILHSKLRHNREPEV